MNRTPVALRATFHTNFKIQILLWMNLKPTNREKKADRNRHRWEKQHLNGTSTDIRKLAKIKMLLYFAFYYYSFAVPFPNQKQKNRKITHSNKQTQPNCNATEVILFTVLSRSPRAQPLSFFAFCARARSIPHKWSWLRREHTTATQLQQQTDGQPALRRGRITLASVWLCVYVLAIY